MALTFINDEGLPTTVSPDNPLPIAGGGGGGSSDGLTDEELRASPVDVTGPLTNTQLRASAVPVSGPLTNAQFTALVGTTAATGPWDGVTNSATILQVLKAIYLKLDEGVALLNTIADNTAPA